MTIPCYIFVDNDMDMSGLHSDLEDEVSEPRRWRESEEEQQSSEPNRPLRRLISNGEESRRTSRPAMEEGRSSHFNSPPSVPRRRQSATITLDDLDDSSDESSEQGSFEEEEDEEELTAAILGVLSVMSVADTTTKDSQPHIPRRRQSLRRVKSMPRSRWAAYAA